MYDHFHVTTCFQFYHLFKAFFYHVCLKGILQTRNYQVSKKVVYEIKFGDIAVMKILLICGVVTGILIVIVSLRCLK